MQGQDRGPVTSPLTAEKHTHTNAWSNAHTHTRQKMKKIRSEEMISYCCGQYIPIFTLTDINTLSTQFTHTQVPILINSLQYCSCTTTGRGSSLDADLAEERECFKETLSPRKTIRA